MIRLADITGAWNRFFHAPESPLAIAAYRAVFGFVVLVNQLLLLPDALVWFGQRGVLPVETAMKLSAGNGISLFRILPQSDASVWFIFACSIVCAIALMLGVFSRISAAGVFLTLASLNHRDTLILMSGDSFMRIASFFLIFSRAGDALCLPRWLAKRRGRALPPPAPSPPWAQRLIQLQLSFLYLYAFVWKSMGLMWLNGTALYYTSRLPEFYRFPVPYMLEHMWTIRLNTWGTLVVEFALGTLVWVKELRYPVLIAGALLHAGIEYSMNIPLFGLIMVSAYITFIDPRDVERFLAWLRRPRAAAESKSADPVSARSSLSSPRS